MIPNAPDVIRGGYRFSEEIMLKQQFALAEEKPPRYRSRSKILT